jgi:serine/threonine-protein kinase
MPLLRGETLEHRLERVGKLPASEVIRIGREIAMGLTAAHERGLMHRDIKPANVWLEADSGRVKILDFGLARAVSSDVQITREGTFIGTPAYMAPEQMEPKGVDYRCDLFGLGCVLYHASTGISPFQREDTMSTLMAVATHLPPPPALVNPLVPEGLSALIMKLVAKNPSDRPTTAADVARALTMTSPVADAVAADTHSPWERAGGPDAAVPTPRLRRLAFVTIAILLVAVGLAGTIAVRIATTGSEPAFEAPVDIGP